MTKTKVEGRVIAVLENVVTGEKRVYEAKNIVTDAGDIYYAERGANATPTNDFAGANGRLELGTSTTAPGKPNTYSALTSPEVNSRKTWDSTYPKNNDDDTDNTGATEDTVTYRVSYTTSDFNSASITDCVIHAAGESPVGGSALLMHADFTAFAKTSTDTLKFFVNHTMVGV